MRRKLNLALMIGMISFATVAAITGSIAWFTPTASISKEDNQVDGSTLGAYFAYGNGSPTSAQNPNDRVYGITNPRHLYNLAWLQYLGFFNKSASDGGKQFYFELADNIDMTGWVLPPIGTENKPFIGNFNGNGYVVSNLTISNRFNDYDKHPSDVNLGNFEQPHIIGFFGVIGDYNSEWNNTYYSSAANEFKNTGLSGITIHTYTQSTLMGIAAGYVSAGMSNIAVDASTLNIDNSITNSTVSFGGKTNNISDFSLVGYTTHTKQVKKIDESIYDVNVDNGYASTGKYYEFNGQDQGEGETGWGGSIDMKSVTQRLQRIRSNVAGTTTGFQYYKEYEYHNNVPSANNPITTRKHGDSRNDENMKLINSNDQIGHFNFIWENQNVANQYALLGGGHWEKHNYYVSAEHNGRFITDGTNYLTFNGTAFVNSTNPNDATLWTFTQYNNNVYYISTEYNGTTYYINYNNGALNTSTTTGTSRRWQVDDTGTYRDIKYNSGTNYHLTYKNGWTLLNTSGSAYYLIHDQNGHYMGATSSRVPTSVTEENALKFGYVTTGNYRGYNNQSSTNYYLSFRNNTNYYLQVYNNNINAMYRLYDSTTSTTAMTAAYGTGYLRTTVSNSNTAYTGTNGRGRFVRWYNNAWTSTTTATQATQITIDYIDPSQFTPILTKTVDETTPHYGPDETFDDTKSTSGMVYSDNDVSYFPLSTVDNTSDYTPADNNTAYVVAGSALTESTNYYYDLLTNVRFGYYTISGNISNDFNVNSGTFTNVFTVIDNSKVNITNSTDYEKLEDAKTNLGKVLKNDGTNVYGVHFMPGAISKDAIMTAPYVRVNKVVHENYELPVNSIDFHLKEFGYINFMAGTYYTRSTSDTNNSFFSLYQIERDSDSKIAVIWEVMNIYKHTSGNKNYSYVYELYDGTNTVYTKPYKVIDAEGNKQWLYDTNPDHHYEDYQYESSLPSNYVLAFNCQNIKKNTITQSDFTNHVYYFEIPMNDGEFCLGSVEDGIGSYLMYLDIGANASKYQRTIFYEKFEISETLFTRPDGVALVSLPDPSTYEKETPVIAINVELDYEDSACVRIVPGTKQTYTMDRNNNTVTLTRSNQSNAPPVYAGEAITIYESGSSTPIQPSYDSSTTKIIKRMTYYDVNVNLDTLMVTQVTDVSTNGGSSYQRMRIVQKIYPGKDDTATPSATYIYDVEQGIDQRDKMKVFNTSNGNKYTNANLIDTSILQIPDNMLPGQDDVVLVVRIIQQGNNGYTEEINIHATIDNNNTNGSYYLYNNYKILVTTTDGTVIIKVISIDSGAQVYYGETKATTVGQVITITVP